jgi:hypothetical protein
MDFHSLGFPSLVFIYLLIAVGAIAEHHCLAGDLLISMGGT